MQSSSDFWTGTAIGVAAGALGLFLVTKLSPAFNNSSLPAQSNTIVMSGGNPTVGLHVGDALTINALNGTFTSISTSGDPVLDQTGSPGSSRQIFKIVATGTVVISTTDSAGVQSTLTVSVT